MKATPLGDTNDSRNYIDKATITLRGESRFTTDAELLKVRDATGVTSMRASREYDCANKKYRVPNLWAWPLPFFGGDNLRLPDPTKEWIAPAAGTVGDLLVKTVCSA